MQDRFSHKEMQSIKFILILKGAELCNLIFHPLEVACRDSDRQLQAGEKYLRAQFESKQMPI